MPSRLTVYRDLLLLARERGYEITSVGRLWSLLRGPGLTSGQRVLCLRHDIDTGIRTARRMWEIDRALGVRASYFFRLSTRDVDLMREIHRDGGEVSYHYEEIATEAKRLALHSTDEIRRRMPEIQAQFRRNLEDLRREVGAPMTIVASHGDWVNRRLGVANWTLLEDPALRVEVGIELEVYDEAFRRHLTSRHSDRAYPRFWDRDPPYVALDNGTPIVYVLVHPRHWHVDRADNLRENWRRLEENIRFGS
jgi:hypothetical protein